MKNLTTQSFVACVDDKYMDTIHDLADKLKEKGAKIDGVHEITGMITGSIDKNDSLTKLKIKGITSVDKSRQVKKK